MLILLLQPLPDALMRLPTLLGLRGVFDQGTVLYDFYILAETSTQVSLFSTNKFNQLGQPCT